MTAITVIVTDRNADWAPPCGTLSIIGSDNHWTQCELGSKLFWQNYLCRLRIGVTAYVMHCRQAIVQGPSCQMIHLLDSYLAQWQLNTKECLDISWRKMFLMCPSKHVSRPKSLSRQVLMIIDF